MQTIRKRWAVDGSDLDTRAENLDRDRDKHVKEGVQTLTRAEYTKWLERLQDLNAELAGSTGYAWASAVTLRHTLSMIAAHDPAFVTTFKLTHATQIKNEPDTVLEKLKDHIEELESTEMQKVERDRAIDALSACLLYTSPSPRDATLSRMPSSA